MKKKIFGFFIIILIVFCIGAITKYFKYISTKKIINFEMKIDKNSRIDNILSTISYQNKIFNKIYFNLNKKSNSIKKGYYLLSGSYCLNEIIDILNKGKVIKINVTIPEGLTLKEIEKILLDKKVIKSIKNFQNALKNIKNFPFKKFQNNYQGYFFPNTYRFHKYEQPSKVIGKFFRKFFKEFPPNLYKKKDEFYKAVILASIIQKESPNDIKMAEISSVFHNRIKIGMSLQSDVTIHFILEKLFNKKKNRLLYKDLKIKSPFNTYLNRGYPPAPICNPGKTAIMAALNPAKTKYIYFLTTKNNEIKFSKSFIGHVKHKKEYLKK